ncbi:MAG: hypothetical protein L0338_16155 [Acidobacteria bacterium]|nr:hypothetical protein [Acidobacteriota bacterium]
MVFLCVKLRATEAERYAIGDEDSKRPLTVADSIESTKVLRDFPNDPILISRDGRRYLVLLQRGDIARNGTWIELLSGNTASLDAASKPAVVARLFSKSTATVTDLIKNVRWLEDNQHVAFLWDDGPGLPQVFVVDARTHRKERLTNHPATIEKYDISRDGKTVIYIARSTRSRSNVAEMRSKGFAVTDQDIRSLLRDDIDGWTPSRPHYQIFVTSTREARGRKVRGPDLNWFIPPELLTMSPDGRYAIAVQPAGDIPADWDKYTEHIFKDVYLPPARQRPGARNWIRRYYVIDTQQATSRALWDAPSDPYGGVVWSPDSRSLIVGPTFLPAAQADAAGLAGRAVVEVDLATGNYVQVAVPAGLPPLAYRPLSWNPQNVVEFMYAEGAIQRHVRLRFRKFDGQWTRIAEESRKDEHSPPVRIELRQDPNTPPALYAVEVASGRETLVRNLNPQLSRLTLGRVELINWKGADGRPWRGMLYYPVHYDPGRRFPLVIQTRGYSATDFSLDGSFTTVFAAQPLANRDIAVLQVGGPDSGMENLLATPREPEIHMAGYEGAIEKLAAAGLADREKVGIIGFSRSGWHVLYALTHSQFRFAAAEVADNMDASYLQYVLGEYKGENEKNIGAAPFGQGLEAWMRRAPGFNADKVYTPLRMELDGGPIVYILSFWEMFSNLRYLQKPVELFVIPDIEHGVHVLQNPAQRLASQGGTVDWFTFWLKGEEDPDRSKAGQYARWRGLRELQERSTTLSPGRRR